MSYSRAKGHGNLHSEIVIIGGGGAGLTAANEIYKELQIPIE